jgi:GxxExxY protein
MADLLHSNITDEILRCFYRGGNKMGHGFLESVYRNVMYIELTAAGVKVKTGVRLPVRYEGRLVGDFETDLIVEELVIVEIKAGRAIDPSATAQVINYLRASQLEVGLILNFGPRLEFRRILFDNKRKVAAVDSAAQPNDPMGLPTPQPTAAIRDGAADNDPCSPR